MSRAIKVSLSFLLVLLIGSAGCSGAGGASIREPSGQATRPPQPVVSFPPQARIVEALGPAPDLAASISEGTVHVPHWELTTSPVVGDPEYRPEGPFERILDAAAESRGVTPRRSASLRCVAQEAARFAVEHEGWPTHRLTRFLRSACGSSLPAVTLAGSRGTVDRRTSDERLVTQEREHFERAIGAGIVEGASVGLGFARRGERTALVLASGIPLMRLDPPEAPGVDGLAVIRGTLLREDAHGVVAHVNQGEHGVARCRVTPGFQLPVVELRCPMREEDVTARVQIRTATLGRVLTRHVASTLLRRTPDAVPVFDASPVGEPAVIDDPSQAGAIVVERLNTIRAAAGLHPVALSSTQSGVHQEVGPHLLASLATSDADRGDVLTLGLLAGWAITGGTIRRADIVGEIEVGGADAAEWIAAALEQPSGRSVLLSSEARQLAVGAVPVAQPAALGMVVSTYAFFEDVDHAADAELYFRRISEARAARGLPPPRRLTGLERADAHLSAVAAGRESPHAALERTLQEETQAHRRSLRGVAVEVLDLRASPLPEALFERRQLTLGVAIGHTRAPGAAWGQYVVFLIVG